MSDRFEQDMYFPPGDPVAEEDPRRLLDELWRMHDRTREAPYGERYVAFMPLIDRAADLPEAGWGSFLQLYRREHVRRRLAADLELDWMERARTRRAEKG